MAYAIRSGGILHQSRGDRFSILVMPSARFNISDPVAA
jgi:hypothetical protein